MESVDLEMEDIFDEQAQEDDFPSMAPLPDLPDGQDGTENQSGEEDENSAEVLSRLKDLSKGAAKKVIRRPQPKLDATRLTGERGIPILPKVFEDVKFKGKGHEARDLQIIMRYLEHWAHRLFPKMPFDEVLERIERLGTKNEVKTCIKKMRLDMPILKDEFVDEEEDGASPVRPVDDETGNVDVDAEEAWEEMMAEQRQASSSQSTMLPSTEPPRMSQLETQLSLPLTPSTSHNSIAGQNGVCSSQGLTPEQKERLERNKQLAMERRAAKQGIFKTPATPKSPARRAVSHTVSSPSQGMMSPPTSFPPRMCSHGNIPIDTSGSQPTFHSLVTSETSQNTSQSSPVTSSSTENSPIRRQQIHESDNELSEIIPLVSVNKVLADQDVFSNDSYNDMSEVIPDKANPRKSRDLSKTSSDQMSEEELLLHLSESD